MTNIITAGLIARSSKLAAALGVNFISQIIERDCHGKREFEDVDFDDMAGDIFLRGVHLPSKGRAYGLWQDTERPHIGISLLWNEPERKARE